MVAFKGRQDNHGGGKSARKTGTKPFGAKKAADTKKKGGKLTSVKNQIRAVKRLLQRGTLLPKAAAEQTQRLQELTESLDDHKKTDLQRKYATKYHKIRFFERVKLERQIKQLERRPASEADQAAAAERNAKLAVLRDDLLYVTHFPKEEKYVSVLKQSEDAVAQAQLEAERARLRAIVHARQKDLAMVNEADEGRSLAFEDQPAMQTSDGEQDDFFLASDDEPGGSQPDGSMASDREDSDGGGAFAPDKPHKSDSKLAQQHSRNPHIQRVAGNAATESPAAAKHSAKPQQRQPRFSIQLPKHKPRPPGLARDSGRRMPNNGAAEHQQHMRESKPQAHKSGIKSQPKSALPQPQPARPPQKAPPVQQAKEPVWSPAQPRSKQQSQATPVKAGPSSAAAATPKPRLPGQPQRTRAEGGRKRRRK